MLYKMRQHKRGTPYPEHEPAFMVRPNIFAHGSVPTPVINPNIVLPHIYRENPALQSTMLVVDILRHNNLDQALADAPEDVRWRMRKTTESKSFSKKQVNQDIPKGEPKAFYACDDRGQLQVGVVLPFLLGKDVLGPDSTLSNNNMFFQGGVKTPEPGVLVVQNAIAFAHEAGHVSQHVNRDFGASKAAITDNLAPDVASVAQHPAVQSWQEIYAMELYADSFAAKVVSNAVSPRDFLAGAALMVDGRTINTMAHLVSTPPGQMPEMIFATSMVWHQAIQDIAKPDGNEKSPLQRVQNGALSMAEIVETMSLYQGLYHDRVCSGPNEIIKAVGERAQHARTPYGAILARDYVVALDRHFPAHDIDPAIMQTAMKQIHQSPAGQQFLPACPDLDMASFAATHRIRTQEQQALTPAIPTATPARRMR